MLFVTILVSIVLLVSGHPYGSHCPDGWELYIRSEHCIAGFREELSWLDAYKFCAARNASLVTIRDSMQNFHIATIAEKTFGACNYWIGLSSATSNNYHDWATGERITYSNWAPETVLNQSGASAAYFALQEKNRWFITEEVAENNCFICEIGSDGSPIFLPTTTPSFHPRTSTTATVETTTTTPQVTVAESTTEPSRETTTRDKPSSSLCDKQENKEQCGENLGIGNCIELDSDIFHCYCIHSHAYSWHCTL